jgi:hypothetical protein
MLVPVMLLIGVVGVVAFVAATISLVRIIMMAPNGERIATLNRLSWLQTDRIKASLGPAVEPPLAHYSRSLITFLACVVLLAVSTTLVVIANQGDEAVTGWLHGLPFPYSPTLES